MAALKAHPFFKGINFEQLRNRKLQAPLSKEVRDLITVEDLNDTM